tara:strand:+ start:22962 stop:23897 length:936 start_codon:yes stop_codon:yes gene_type:complete
MAYQQGDTITATDYNNFVANVNVVIGTGTGDQGYGLSEIATVSVGSTITATQWNNLLGGLQTGANHQGTTLTNASNSVSTGGNIVPLSNLDTDITLINTNRLNAAGANMSTGLAGTSSSRTSAWTGQVQHAFTVTYASANAARHFFNSGGKIKMAFSRSGGSSTNQNTSWTNQLSDLGTVTMAANATSISGSSQGGNGANGSRGFHQLNGTPAEILNTTSSASDYTANDIDIKASISGAVVTITISFNDDHTAETGNYTGGGLGNAPNEGQAWTGTDSVDGTLSSTVTFDKADNASFVQVASPSFSNTITL